MSTPRTTCAVLGCTQPVNGIPFGSMCDLHAARQYRNGSPHAKALPIRAINEHREAISKALARYRDTPAVKAAVSVASRLLHFKAPQEFTVYLEIEKHMARLRAGGVTERDLLERVCCVWALQARDQRFDTERELQYALARAVLRLRPLRPWRPAGPLLRYLGSEIVEELGKFAAGLCMKMAADDEDRRAARKAFEEWVSG